MASVREFCTLSSPILLYVARFIDHRCEGIDDNATFLHGFSAAEFERRRRRGSKPRVWASRARSRPARCSLINIHALVTPDEICPVLPSPAQNLREADDLNP